MESVIASAQQLNVEVVENGSLVWVNVERPGTAEMAYLRGRYGFHQLSLDDCLSVVQMPKLDEFDDHLFMVMHFPQLRRAVQDHAAERGGRLRRRRTTS